MSNEDDNGTLKKKGAIAAEKIQGLPLTLALPSFTTFFRAVGLDQQQDGLKLQVDEDGYGL